MSESSETIRISTEEANALHNARETERAAEQERLTAAGKDVCEFVDAVIRGTPYTTEQLHEAAQTLVDHGVNETFQAGYDKQRLAVLEALNTDPEVEKRYNQPGKLTDLTNPWRPIVSALLKEALE